MDVLMPQLGETVAEGKIVKWFKAVGDTVAAGDVLFEIETDKTSMEVPAVADGMLTEIRVPQGEVVLVGSVCCVIGEAGQPPAASAPRGGSIGGGPDAAPGTRGEAPPTLAPAAQPVRRELDPFEAVKSPERNFGRATLASGAKITPLARRLASQAGLEPATLKATGPHGRIVAADVRKAAEAKQATLPAGGGMLTLGASADQVMAMYADAPFEVVALDGMRRTVARRLMESKQTIPHFYLTAEVEIEELMALRRQLKDGGVSVSVNDFVVKAYALALQSTPSANAVWAEDRILKFTRSDVGVAVAVEGGLFTPVIRAAESKSLRSISAEIRELATRARERRLKPSEYQGGAAAISNLGMYGVREFAAIVNPPHSTILAVGAGERRPVEGPDGGVRFVSKMTVTLSADHRVVDGALGAELLAAFKTLIENPISILV